MFRLARVLPGIFCLFVTTVGLAQRSQTAVVAAAGDPTPDGDHIAVPDDFGLNDTGSVFSAQLQTAGVTAVFTKIRARETEILRVGDTFTSAGTITSVDNPLSLNRHGSALVSATTLDSSSVTHNTLLTGSDVTNVRAVVVSDATVPDGNGQFDDFISPSINDRSDVGFWASIKNSQGTTGFQNAIFIGHTNGSITEVARTGQPAPGETNTFFSMDFPAPINPLGQIAFAGEINDANFGTGNNYGLYRGTSSGSLVKLARSFDPAPNTPYLLGFLQVGGVNSTGVTCFYASLITSTGLFKGYGLFTSSTGTDVKTIAYVGQNAPKNLGLYTAFDSLIDVNDAGQAAYLGFYTGVTSGSGIFLWDGATQAPLATTGKTAPDRSVFTGFGSCHINNQGIVLFAAQTDNAPGLNSIYLTSGTKVVKVVKIGDVINGIQVSGFVFDPEALNERNQVMYEAFDPNGNARIMLFTAPPF